MRNRYAVEHPITGEVVLFINRHLLKSKGSHHNLKKIKAMHQTKLLIHHEILQTEDIRVLRSFAKDLELVEFELQKLWGFPEDARFHAFWRTPKCTCPKLDNDDNYPTGYYITNFECRIHGGQNGN